MSRGTGLGERDARGRLGVGGALVGRGWTTHEAYKEHASDKATWVDHL